MKEVIVDTKYDGKKLDTFLLNTFSGLSKNVLYKALRKKDIRINDVKTSQNEVVHAGDHVKVYICDAQLLSSSFSIDVIYEDENIMVVNKPAGIEVVGSSFSLIDMLHSSITSCSTNSPNSFFLAPCHRLDRNTTGLVLLAKNETALNILLEKFKNRQIEKLYRAKVYGIPKENEKLLNAYLFKDSKKAMVYISDVPKKGYTKISTYYKVIECDKKNNTSILEVKLLTGKTHQIRAHLAHINLPIIGDGKYGINEINKKFGYKFQQLQSYSIGFKFSSPAGNLEYLNNKVISLANVTKRAP